MRRFGKEGFGKFPYLPPLIPDYVTIIYLFIETQPDWNQSMPKQNKRA